MKESCSTIEKARDIMPKIRYSQDNHGKYRLDVAVVTL